MFAIEMKLKRQVTCAAGPAWKTCYPCSLSVIYQ